MRNLSRYEIDALSPEDFLRNKKELIKVSVPLKSQAEKIAQQLHHSLKDDYTKEEIIKVRREL